MMSNVRTVRIKDLVEGMGFIYKSEYLFTYTVEQVDMILYCEYYSVNN